jgi:pyruvate kinase
MLSGESAQGDYPYEAVTYLGKIANKAEESIDHQLMIDNVLYNKEDKDEYDAIGLAAATLCNTFEIPAVVAEGDVDLALALSEYRPATDIFFAVDNERDARTLSIVWGVTAVVGKLADAKACAVKTLELTKEDKIIEVVADKLEIKNA